MIRPKHKSTDDANQRAHSVLESVIKLSNQQPRPAGVCEIVIPKSLDGVKIRLSPQRVPDPKDLNHKRARLLAVMAGAASRLLRANPKEFSALWASNNQIALQVRFL